MTGLVARVLVYGTLRRGMANHDRFCFDIVDVIPAWTRGRLYALPYGFPAMVPADDGRVIGELLFFPDPAAALHRLDHLEGFRPDGPCHYDRIVVEAHLLAGGETVRAWCYVYGDGAAQRLVGAKVLAAGDWARVDPSRP